MRARQRGEGWRAVVRVGASVLLVLTVCGAARGQTPRAESPFAMPKEFESGAWFDLDDPRAGAYWRRNLFLRVVDDQRFLVQTWARNELFEPEISVPVLAMTLLAASNEEFRSADRSLTLEIYDSGGSSRDGLTRGFTKLGDGSSAVVILGASWLISRWRHDDRLGEATSLATEALIDGALWGTLLKRATSRTRPLNSDNGEFFQYGVTDPEGPSSFPSGHALGAFSVASVFAHCYRDQRWVGVMAYGLAGLIGVSRVALGRHYVSDVAVGALLGYSIGRMVATRAGHGTDREARWEPLVDPLAKGIGISYQRRW